MAFIAIDDIKTEIGMDLADTTYDSLLNNLSSAVIDLLDRLTNRTWVETEHTEYHNGAECYNIVLLKNYPVKSKAFVTLYDDPDWEYGNDTLIDAEDFQVDLERGIIYYNSRFFACNQNIKVVYTAGYTDTSFPSGYKQVLVRQAAHWFKQARNQEWDVSSKSNPSGSGSISFAGLENNLLPDFKMMVEEERRIQ